MNAIQQGPLVVSGGNCLVMILVNGRECFKIISADNILSDAEDVQLRRPVFVRCGDSSVKRGILITTSHKLRSLMVLQNYMEQVLERRRAAVSSKRNRDSMEAEEPDECDGNRKLAGRESSKCLRHSDDAILRENDDQSTVDGKENKENCDPTAGGKGDENVQSAAEPVIKSADEKTIVFGENRTSIETSAYQRLSNTCYKLATRGLLMAVFSRQTLATHCLTGRPSPAFLKTKPATPALDAGKVADIVDLVCSKFKRAKRNLVRATITSKCADEHKMLVARSKRQQTEESDLSS